MIIGSVGLLESMLQCYNLCYSPVYYNAMDVSLSFPLYVVQLNIIIIITSSCSLSDGELWPYQELPGPGGDVHDSDDHPVTYRGEESHHRTVQLRPWDDAWSQVIWHYSTVVLFYIMKGRMMHGLIITVLCLCVAVIGSTPDWARWSWIMRTLSKRWWKSLFPMER